jgi:tryptophan-rich sensory protein
MNSAAISRAKSRRRWQPLIWFLLLCIGVQLVGGLLTGMSVGDWYVTLEKPSWNPPGWVFAPVWTLLYLSMGVAAWLVWERRDRRPIRVAMVLLGVQLALNLAWSGLFFALQSPEFAFYEIVFLWLAILTTLVEFWRIRTTAGLLLVPYLAWVSFAASLNWMIWRLNM